METKYFAVYIPSKNENDENLDIEKVFESKLEAIKLFKLHKEARLKGFKTREEADEFSRCGQLDQKINIQGLKSPSSLTVTGEKSIHRSLMPQELVAFRKEIEQNRLSSVYQMVMENPRYIVNIAAIVPTILKEGPRYNALHVAILSKHYNMCKLILQTIEKPHFIEMLNGPTQSEVNAQEASLILLESYLNMPDKARRETPLHFASKLGLKDIIELLLAYPLCKSKPNFEGCLPKDVICQRCPDASPELKKTISEMLEERFFVPVFRSVDNTTPPVIGEPFSGHNLPVLESDSRLSPKMEIVAYAGPMDKDQAQSFRRRWKTPPRVSSASRLKSPGSPLTILQNTPPRFGSPSNNNNVSTPLPVRGRRLFEDHNGNSQEEENQAPPVKNEFATRFFREYRDNANDSLMSNNSVMLEDEPDSPAVKERHVRLTDVEKGVEIVGRELAKSANVEWKEYWKFLGKFVDLTSAEGLEMLEKHLQKRSQEGVEPIQTPEEAMFDLCEGLNSLHLKETQTPRSKKTSLINRLVVNASPNMAKNVTKPFYLIEKALQVYAKRTSDNINRNRTKALAILEQELGKLKSFVLSYCQDNRFFLVNCKRAHARYARLVKYYLGSSYDFKLLRSQGEGHGEEIECIVSKIDSLDPTTPNSVETEVDCEAAWEKELECSCDFTQSHVTKSLPRDRRKFRMNQWQKHSIGGKEKIDVEKDLGVWEARDPMMETSVESLELNDEDFFSCESDLDMDFGDAETSESSYGTPPESPSPSEFESVEDSDSSSLGYEPIYENFINGPYPTKTDTDVLKAITSCTIPQERYPNIFHWKTEMQLWQRKNHFPSTPCKN